MVMYAIPPELECALTVEFKPQGKIAWVRDTWNEQLKNCPFLADLPDAMDRQEVAQIVNHKLESEAVIDAFLAVMIWGYGRTGYGAYRTNKILENHAASPAELAERLRSSADTVRATGPLEGYRWMQYTSKGKVKGLGPAFFTKWLSFTSAKGEAYGPDTVPILDNLTRGWFKRNTDYDPGYNRIRGYEVYVVTLEQWGETTGKSSAQVEAAIFSLVRQKERG